MKNISKEDIKPVKGFMTPGGLKIRLELDFFCQTFENKYSDDSNLEIINKTNGLLSIIDATSLCPWIFLYTTTLLYIFLSGDTASLQIYALYAMSSFLCGKFLSLIHLPLPDWLICTVCCLLNYGYRYTVIRYIVLVAFAIITKKYIILLWYLLACLIGLVVELLVSQFILIYSERKYQIPFTDAEMIAFKRLNLIINNTRSESEKIIDEYKAYIDQTETEE